MTTMLTVGLLCQGGAYRDCTVGSGTVGWTEAMGSFGCCGCVLLEDRDSQQVWGL